MTNFITCFGYHRLEKLLSNLLAQRDGIIDEVSNTRSQGDLKENEGYQLAKNLQEALEEKIKNINQIISKSFIVSCAQLSADNRIVFGSLVQLRHINCDLIYWRRIVSVEESFLIEDTMSAVSEVAKAIKGRYQGDSVTLYTAGQYNQYEIKKF